jgi:hypothetical protein
MGKPKQSSTLRELYMGDEEAAAFLKAHPEFAGYDMEEAIGSQGGGRTVFDEPEPSRQSEGASKIIEALPHYPDRTVTKYLARYYDGEPLRDIARALRKSINKTRVQLQRWRAAVLLWATSRPWEAKRLSPAEVCNAKKRLIYGKEGRDVYRVAETWVDADWNVFPAEVQAALDDIEWEFLDLGVTE